MEINTIITILCATLASTGLWTFLTKFLDRKNDTKELLLGIAHDRIVYLGMLYIQRGWITQDEYENLDHYLYSPYKKLGGNGVCTRVMNGVTQLPITRTIPPVRADGESITGKDISFVHSKNV